MTCLKLTEQRDRGHALPIRFALREASVYKSPPARSERLGQRRDGMGSGNDEQGASYPGQSSPQGEGQHSCSPADRHTRRFTVSYEWPGPRDWVRAPGRAKSGPGVRRRRAQRFWTLSGLGTRRGRGAGPGPLGGIRTGCSRGAVAWAGSRRPLREERCSGAADPRRNPPVQSARPGHGPQPSEGL